MMMKIAVVGAGYWGKNLIRNFKQLGMLHAICENDPDNPNLAPYNEVKLYTSFHELLKDKEVEAIAIATPAITHYAFVKQALLSGKDVFIEKFFWGRTVPEFKDEYIRELIYGSYRIIYLIRNDDCYISAVIHGSRDILRHLKPGDWDI